MVSKGVVSPPLRKALICPLLKKPSLDPAIRDKFHLVCNLSFGRKVIEKVVTQQLLTILDEADYLEYF